MLPESNAHAVRVTVFVPVFNAEKYLAHTIVSVLNQTFTDFELLAIDDGSIDKSVQILNGFGDRRIRIIKNNRNRGRPYTRNRGIGLARGEFLSVLDSDDLSEPERLARQIEFLDSHPDIAAVGSSATYIDENGQVAFICTVPTDSEEIHRRLFQSNCFIHSSVTFRRQALLDIGGYNSEFPESQDYELFLRLSAHHRLANILDPLVRYRVHPNQVSQRKVSSQRRLADRARIEAYKSQLHEGLIPPSVSPPTISTLSRLRGEPGTVGDDYLSWITTYQSLGREELARPLVFSALINAPLSRRAWREVGRVMGSVMLSASSRNLLRWYWRKVHSILRRGQDS